MRKAKEVGTFHFRKQRIKEGTPKKFIKLFMQ